MLIETTLNLENNHLYQQTKKKTEKKKSYTKA